MRNIRQKDLNIRNQVIVSENGCHTQNNRALAKIQFRSFVGTKNTGRIGYLLYIQLLQPVELDGPAGISLRDLK